MNKEQKIKLLESVAKSPEGEAIIQHLQEKITYLIDGRNYNNDDFEIDGLASVKAADILDELVKDLKSYQNKKITKGKDQYN